MSSNPTKAEPRRFMDITDLLSAIGGVVTQADPTAPMVIAIAGGSAGGKTTVAGELVARLGDQAVLFSQDLFQFGSDFAERKTSPYKWDDPRNFDLEAGVQALAGLRAGQAVTVPRFDVVANKRQGHTTIAPRPVIVWEGIYAFLTPQLRQAADLAVMVKAPYPLRLLRRISRFLMRDDIDDMSVPARQMLTFVLRAEIDHVSRQASSADMILEVAPTGLDDEIALLRQRAGRHMAAMTAVPDTPAIRTATYGGLDFRLFGRSFTVTDVHGRLLYGTTLDEGVVRDAADGWSRLTDTID